MMYQEMLDFEYYTYAGNEKRWRFTLLQMPSDRRLKLKAEINNYLYNYTSQKTNFHKYII